ncbi:hypothetical protein [Thermaerobacillus caldiproteolyticus]|uniref:hypothetical protein n=1 Tax=Thermaerobacillus caldiproteolyticus TaxID=247480 RepID=UPI00188DA6F7|nr:hypothetical protein [Anoxybacillus caldiproteolyticus]QPA32616.1 hypothetical protein ISX45_06710 [Anoxybacillus caldiproteolyticus]
MEVNQTFLRRWLYSLSITLGALIAITDYNADEPFNAIILLFIFGVFLGGIYPSGAWKFSIALAVFIPIINVLSVIIHGRHDLFISQGIGSFIALIPSVISCYIGAWINKFLTIRHAAE